MHRRRGSRRGCRRAGPPPAALLPRWALDAARAGRSMSSRRREAKKPQPRKRALVTGAAGFTGRVLCGLLVDEGVDVFAAGRRPGVTGKSVTLGYPVSAEKMNRL